MAEREALLALAERCEKATGPDRELDVAVWLATTPGATREQWDYTHKATGKLCHMDETRDGTRRLVVVPDFTASLDAAMSLVPQSGGDTLVFCRSGNDGEGGNPDTFKAEVLVCTGLTSKLFTATAATEPLARAAAFIRARAAQGDDQ